MAATLIGQYSTTALTTDAVQDVTLSGVVAADGDSIVVCILTSSGALFNSIEWGAETFADVTSSPQTIGAGEHRMMAAHNVAGGTHDVIIGWTITPGDIVVEVLVYRGFMSSPLDLTKPATGSGTAPSSGASATTAQAAEFLLASVATHGPVSDNAGAWSNSFASVLRTGTAGGTAGSRRTISTGALQVAATAAYTGAKTGITSRTWGVILAAFKTAADVSVTAGAPGASSGAAPAATITSGGVSVTAAAPGSSSGTAPTAVPASGGISVSAGAPGAAVGGSPTPTIASGGVTVTAAAPGASVGGAPEISGTLSYMGTDANGVLEPTTPISDGAASLAQSRGIRSFGLPYFAMWMQNPAGFVDMRYPVIASLLLTGGFTVIAAINRPPVQIDSVDEVHFFASYQEIGGLELFSLGVTPDLRLALRMADGPILYSAGGLVLADGVARTYTVFTTQDSHFGAQASRRRRLMIDDLIVASDVRDGISSLVAYVDGKVSPTGKPTRVMLFNGVEGRTLMDCTIFYVAYVAAIWPMTPINGLSTPGIAGEYPVFQGVVPYADADFTLTAGFYDPAPWYARVAGDFPSDAAQTAFRRVLNTQYRLRNIVTPNYTLVGA